MFCGRRANLLHGGVADAACRIVDDALHSLLVVGVAHQPEVGDDVLDFLALIEAQTAVDAVGNALSAHLLLEGAALRIGAVEDGEVAILAVLPAPDGLDVLANDGCLFLVGVCPLQHQLLAFVVAAVDVLRNLPLVLLDQTVGGLHDALRGTVVLLQLEELRVGVYGLEVQDVVDVCSAEGIDALCIVAHHTHALMLARELQHNLLLGVVRVLVLVDEDVLESLLILLQHLAVVAQKAVGHHQQVVEVHRISLAATLLVGQEDAARLGHLRIAVALLHLGVGSIFSS